MSKKATLKRRQYQTIGLGGTFDRLHHGHKSFLDFATTLGNELMIGLTDSKLTQDKPLAHLIESYQVRKRALAVYCQRQGYKFNILKIKDIYGPTLDKSSSPEALVVTSATLKGGELINRQRIKHKLKPLPIHVHSLQKDQTKKPISSARIRQGIISRAGQVYHLIFAKDQQLSSRQNKFFSNNQGALVVDNQGALVANQNIKAKNSHIKTKSKIDSSKTDARVVVGDVCLQKFIDQGWSYDLAIFDQLNERLPYELKNIKVEAVANNPPGFITKNLVKTLLLWTQHRYKHLLIKGEEDLAAVAATLVFPLNTHIYYGQPQEGMIELVVTEKIKQQFAQQF